ncbi:CLUMA_CG015044, isoform A [Clunio marinus]|uniref:CLUMA_CG015044, isoform A n=1 Tax=Clunio marinus TaxID=568069 RepID=A0A1J1INL8_9DIPT|nr:CLUMA_CG015044, isoform A [Clunio marinus]
MQQLHAKKQLLTAKEKLKLTKLKMTVKAVQVLQKDLMFLAVEENVHFDDKVVENYMKGLEHA